ncbi:glycoside hydrolase family 68 protein [Sphingomonas lacunae]|uniref:Glycoside hydrolase family 68 protein n=1 Tax=Sphingomonas lacunae TaxID=2698828 RepID=A0A6M4AUS0_9SPHN|nr:glycoside hydrolase family 68 protein [Sphingomonas lacunae]
MKGVQRKALAQNCAPNGLRWEQRLVANWHDQPGRCFPLITPADVVPVDLDRDYWDAWPLLTPDGQFHAAADGRHYWFALSAPRFDDPDERHGHARIYLLEQGEDGFRSLGPAMPEGFSPGSREWSGSATIDPESMIVTLWFTASGRRGETSRTMEQRIFRAAARLAGNRLVEWQAPVEPVVADGRHYARADQVAPIDGRILGFRDPGVFRDPISGDDWLVFTASSAVEPGYSAGVIGLARIDANGQVQLLPPLVTSTGFNNELEVPNLRYFDGRYYLFWSTQTHMFEPGIDMPTGLYGAVADDMAGPWRLINGDGLIAATPRSEPLQSYAWNVLPDRRISAFVNHWGLAGRSLTDLPSLRSQFGGTFAPFARLRLDGDRATVSP